MEPAIVTAATDSENTGRRPNPRLLLRQFLTRPSSRLIIEAEDHVRAADHYHSILHRRKPLQDMIKLRPRLFFARCSGSGRYWIFQRH